MRIALYIEDGLEQLVMTPESETEKGILGKMHDGSREMSLKRGSFYACQGGWTRHSPVYQDVYGGSSSRDDESTIVVFRPAKPKPPAMNLAGLADVARAEVENAVPRFLGDDPRALEVAELFRQDMANAVYNVIMGQSSPALTEEG